MAHQQKRGRSPNKEYDQQAANDWLLDTTVQLANKNKNLQEELKQNKYDKEAMSAHYRKEIKTINANHHRETKALKNEHKRETQKLCDDHEREKQDIRDEYNRREADMKEHYNRKESETQVLIHKLQSINGHEVACEEERKRLLTIIVGETITLGSEGAKCMEIVLRRSVDPTKYAAHFKILADYIANPHVFILNFTDKVGIVAPGGHIDINLLLEHYGKE